MIKEIFKDEVFTFSEWIKIYLMNEFLERVFKYDYYTMANERKKSLLTKDILNG